MAPRKRTGSSLQRYLIADKELQGEHKVFLWLQTLQENYVEYKQEHMLKCTDVL